MELSDDMDLNSFLRFDIPALKHFVSQRGLAVSGNKATLAARAFAAYEMQLPLQPSALQREVILEQEYKELLCLEDGTQLPDPFTIPASQWIDEKAGMKHWPPIMIQDISVFVQMHDTVVDKIALSKRLLSDYKDQKAYSYFCSKFLFDVQYNDISMESDYCFLKTRCMPSQRLSEIPHDVWACATKSGGNVVRAYCSCLAGLGQSCNHVVAMLLMVDFQWKVGAVQKACTSMPCVWTEGGKSLTVLQTRLAEVTIKKPAAEKLQSDRDINSTAKKLFSPDKKDKGMSSEMLLERLGKLQINSVTLGERERKRHVVYVKEDDTYKETHIPQSSLPPTVGDIAAACRSSEELITKLKMLTPGDAAVVEKLTRDQGDSVGWHSQRIGRITASHFHEVYTRVNTQRNSPSPDYENLICRLLQYATIPDVPAMKYGRRMEDLAVHQYVKIKQCTDQHEVRRSGLHVCTDYAFIAASPDRIVLCGKCGKGVLEVKCPLSSAHTHPYNANLPYLVTDGSSHKLILKKSHAYYSQVQGQMAVTGATWADFFVYSSHGYHLERILFDDQYWELLRGNLVHFFVHALSLELISRNIMFARGTCVPGSMSVVQTSSTEVELSLDASSTAMSSVTTSHWAAATCKSTQSLDCSGRLTTVVSQEVHKSLQANTGALLAVRSKTVKRKSTCCGRKRKVKRGPVYMCPVCKSRVDGPDASTEPQHYSIMCDKCCKRHHWGCVGICDTSKELESGYTCEACKI